jgi:hypothetical protein
MLEFARSIFGQKFLNGTMPDIARQLDRIASALEKANELKEKEVEQKTTKPTNTIPEENDYLGISEKFIKDLGDKEFQGYSSPSNLKELRNPKVVSLLNLADISVEVDNNKWVAILRRIHYPIHEDFVQKLISQMGDDSSMEIDPTEVEKVRNPIVLQLLAERYLSLSYADRKFTLRKV